MVPRTTSRRPRRRRRPIVQLRAREILSGVAKLGKKHAIGLLLVAVPFAIAAVLVEQTLLNACPKLIRDIRVASMLAFYGTTAIAYAAMAAVAAFAVPRLEPRGSANAFSLKLGNTFTVLLLSLVAPVGIFAGLAVAIVPGIIISLSWCVAPALVVLSGTSVRTALQQSSRLTWGSRRTLFYVFATAYVLFTALSCVSAVLMGRSLSEALFDPTPPSGPELIVDCLFEVVQMAFNGAVSAIFFAAAANAERHAAETTAE